MTEAVGRVLVVDGEEALCRLLCRALGRLGLEATAALSGAEALAVVQCRQPNLIITELELPGMDGIELLRRINGRGETVPVIVLTAHGTAERIREALRLGVREFLGKPFELQRLLRIVGEIVAEEVPQRTSAPPPR